MTFNLLIFLALNELSTAEKFVLQLPLHLRLVFTSHGVGVGVVIITNLEHKIIFSQETENDAWVCQIKLTDFN